MKLAGTVVLVGCGKMGSALLQGWLTSGLSQRQIAVLDPKPPLEVAALLGKHNIPHNPDPASIKDAAALVIAVKPQMMEDVLPSLKVLMQSQPVVISIAAGKTIGGFEKAFGANAAVIRAMPNTPAAIGQGITAFTANAHVSAEQAALAESLLAATGEVLRVKDEAAIDFVTAVSGSGPAYVFYLTECLAEAGAKLGLPAEMAMRLARATVSGSGALMHQSGTEAAILRQNVTSPGGTTFAALQILMANDGLAPLMAKAVAAAAKRAQELAG